MPFLSAPRGIKQAITSLFCSPPLSSCVRKLHGSGVGRAVALALDVCQPCTAAAAAVTLELITQGCSQDCRTVTVESGVTPVTAPKGMVTSPLPPAPLCFPHPSRPQHSSVTQQKPSHPFFRVRSQAARLNQLHEGSRRTQTPTQLQQTLYLTHLAASPAPPVTSGNPAQARAGRL